MDNHNRTAGAEKAGFPAGHALIIAIADYRKAPRLPLAVLNDGRQMVEVLKAPAHCGYAPGNVTQLLDGEATLEAVRRELNALALRSGPDDTVVIFFSGHGARVGNPTDPQSALVPVDGDPANPLATLLLEAEFSAALAQLKARRLVVLIDACHAGAAGSFKGGADLSPGFSEKSLARLAQGTGRVLIASSRATETSLVLHGASNSLFTEYLLAALRGQARTQGDGMIRVFEVFNYVAEKVHGAVPGRQHPIFKASDLEDNFPVALHLGGVKSYGAPTVATVTDVWKQLEGAMADLYSAGPQDQEIWARAGGDISRLRLTGTGRANWFSALRALRQGGGGVGVTLESLIQTALEDFPHHQDLTLSAAAVSAMRA